MSRRHLPLAAIGVLVVSLLVVAPLAWWGTPIGHDAYYHLVWVGQFTDSLRAGILYPRWMPHTNAGLGNPTFVFYPPLTYYVAGAFQAGLQNAPLAFGLTAWLALFASGLVWYRYLREAFAPGPAFLGALASMALPYRVVDLYQRFAIPEFLAFVWPPVALLALRRVQQAASLRAAGPPAVVIAVATAGLALTHLPSLVIWGPILALAALHDPEHPARDRTVPCRAIVTRAWLALGVGLLLAAVYLLPAIAERRFVQMQWLEWVGRPTEHLLFSPQMSRGGMVPFNRLVSRIACGSGALAAVAALAALWPGSDRRRADAPRPLPVAAAAGVALVTFVLLTPWSAFVWRYTPILSAIQFPWRLLVALTPAAGLLTAAAVARMFGPDAPAAVRALGVVTLMLFGANLAQSARLALVAPYNAEVAATHSRNQGIRDAAEYRPKGAPVFEHEFPALPRASADPEGQARVVEWDATRRTLLVEAPAPARLRVATFSYPGWRATVDGRPAPIRPGPWGVIEVDVPSGRHLVDLRFGTTWDRRAGALVSGAALLVLAGWAAWGWRRREA